MIRFIDLRGQVFADDDLPEAERHPFFAFYDTADQGFVTVGGEDAWSTGEDFVLGYRAAVAAWGQGLLAPLERFLALMPPWTGCVTGRYGENSPAGDVVGLPPRLPARGDGA